MAELKNTYKGLTLVNVDKLNRAIFGSTGSQGELTGGVGEDASDDTILAEYDKLGGLIRKGNRKVKTGCFWDSENKRPQKKPKVVFEFHDLKGKKVDIAEDEEVPVEVQAAEKIREEEAEENQKKVAKAEKAKADKKAKGKKGKKVDEEEEGEEEDLSEEDGEEVDEDVE